MKLVVLTVALLGCWTSSKGTGQPAEPTPSASPVADVGGSTYGGDIEAYGGDGYGGDGYGAHAFGSLTGVGLGAGAVGGIGTIGTGGGIGHRPVVHASNPTAGPGLDRAIIQRMIRRHINKIRYCYEKELVTDPALSGRVSVSFTIGVDGKVTTATATGLVPAVSSCIELAIKGIEFPSPKGGGVVNVAYPFVFSPG